MAGTLKIFLMTTVLTALAIACGTGGPVGREDPAPVSSRVVYPASWPVPPLPVMALEHPSGLVWGLPSSYCWKFEEADEPACEEYSLWSAIDAYPEATGDKQIHVRVDSETRPDKMFAQVYTRHGNIMVDFLQLGTEYPVLDLELDPDDYHVRLIGQWQYNKTADYLDRKYNKVAYGFGLSVPGEVALIAECAYTLIGGNVDIVLKSLDDRLRTAKDSVNSAGCKFNKPIVRISLTLASEDATYTETFRIDPPSLDVGFPLPDDLVSENSGETLTPGDYSRRIVATAEDGDEWEASDSFLKTVTIAGP